MKNPPIKNAMITQKYKKQYTEDELNTYIESIKTITGRQSKEVDDAWRTLGYINASTYKGYGKLSDEKWKYNCLVYSIKEEAIARLAEHTDNIAVTYSIVYVRLLDGIQLSFHYKQDHHVPVDINGCKKVRQLGNVLRPYRSDDVRWDGVEESYTYTDIEAYNAAKEVYAQKKREDDEKEDRNIELFIEGIKKFFAHHSTRRSYGLPAKKDQWEKYVEACVSNNEDCWRECSTGRYAEPVVRRFLPASYYDEIERITRIVEGGMPEGWNKFNFKLV